MLLIKFQLCSRSMLCDFIIFTWHSNCAICKIFFIYKVGIENNRKKTENFLHSYILCTILRIMNLLSIRLRWVNYHNKTIKKQRKHIFIGQITPALSPIILMSRIFFCFLLLFFYYLNSFSIHTHISTPVQYRIWPPMEIS